MLAVLVNTLAVLLGSTVGLLARKGIPEKVSGAIMTAISLCTLYAGVSGMLKGENTLVLIVSMVLGTAAGTLLDLDGALARLGKAIESRLRRKDQRGRGLCDRVLAVLHRRDDLRRLHQRGPPAGL